MSDINKTTDIGATATTLVAADTFRESYSIDDGDVETGSPVLSSGLDQTVTSTFDATNTDGLSSTQAAATKKRRLGYFLAGTAVFLIVIGLVVGLPKGGDESAAAATGTTAEAAPSVPQVPVVIETFVPPGSSGDEPAAEVVVVVEQPDEPAEPIVVVIEEPAVAVANDSADEQPAIEQGAPSNTEDTITSEPNFEPQVTIGDAALLNPDYASIIASSAPTVSPTPEPSNEPTTAEPTSEPTAQPTSTPSASPSSQPTSPPSAEPTFKPTNAPIKPLDLSGWEAMSWNVDPTSAPSGSPTPAPSSLPTNVPTPAPSNVPTSPPTTAEPTDLPTASPTRNPYFFGEEYVDVPELGIRMSKGLTVRKIAQTGQKVETINGNRDSWHTRTDAAGIVPMDPNDLSQGYVYMSNSEEGDGGGGVYGLYFDADYNVVDYRTLLRKTTDNCGGGLTPWNTWVSCEEFEDGQCWQIDPVNEVVKETKLGGNGGRYESVAVDNRNSENPIFFTTEDDEEGALRRFIADGNGFDSLHRDPVEETFLNILGDGTFEWTTDEDVGRQSASKHFPNSEGIQFHEGKLYFMPKEKKTMYVLDTDNMTYTSEKTGKKMYGEGDFGDQPDQNMFGPTRKYMYFTEDGGCPGVFARYGEEATYFTMFEATEYCDDETVGIAYSPDHMRFYAAIQDIGLVFEFAREDGMPFE